MQHIVTSLNTETNANLLDQMHRLRARQFRDRRKWQVAVQDGRELDAFDELGPVYILVSDGAGTLLASTRVLPTMGPHMLSDVFPGVMGDAPTVRHPLVWEASRFCVDTGAARSCDASGVNTATRELLHGLFVAARYSGVRSIVAVHDLYMERILGRSGCPGRRMGPVIEMDRGLKTVGSRFEVSDDLIARLAGPNHVAAPFPVPA